MQICIYDSKMYLLQYYANANFITMLLNYIIGQYSNLWMWIASYSPDAISPRGFFLDSYEKTISHTDTQLYAWKQMQSPLCTCIWQLKNKNQVIPLSTKATTTMKIRYAAATSCSFPIVHPPTASNNWKVELKCQFSLWASVVSFQFPLKGSGSTPTDCVRIQWLYNCICRLLLKGYITTTFSSKGQINTGLRPKPKAPRTRDPRTRDPRTRDPMTKSLESCIALQKLNTSIQAICALLQAQTHGYMSCTLLLCTLKALFIADNTISNYPLTCLILYCQFCKTRLVCTKWEIQDYFASFNNILTFSEVDFEAILSKTWVLKKKLWVTFINSKNSWLNL